eukprot:gene29857-36978_t
MSDNTSDNNSAAGNAPAGGPAPNPASGPAAPSVSGLNWEREILEKLVLSTVRERRANRRWGIFFKLMTLVLVFVAIAAYFDFTFPGGDTETLGRHTALIEIEGDIETEGSASAPNRPTRPRAAPRWKARRRW